MASYKISIEVFKENLIDLQSNEKLINMYKEIPPSIKSQLTKKYSEYFKTSIIHKKKKGKIIIFTLIIIINLLDKSDDAYQKYDEDGNLIEEIKPESEDEAEEESNSEIKAQNIVSKVKSKATKAKGTKKK